MTDGLKLFTDNQCTKTGMVIQCGVVAILGDSAHLSNWGSQNGVLQKNTINPADFVFSGGSAIYDFNVPYNLPFPESPTEYDYSSNLPNAPIVWNPYFISCDNVYESNIVLAITTAREPNQYIIRLYSYTQNPFEEIRQTWSYEQTYIFGGMQFYDTAFSQLKMYRGTIEEQEFYFLVLNIKPNGETDSSITRIVGIPLSFWDGRIPEPYAGEESESNAENAYTPTIPYRGSILPRDLTNKRNPYGFNQGNGLSLCIISFSTYAAILQGIYAGTAESVLNKLSQGFAQIVGGNTHRPADEVNAITNAILCCHMIPQITGYASGTMQLKTIAGYHILGGNGDSAITMTLNTTANVLFEFETSTTYVSRRLNSFLDFEPYTSIQLHLPFMPVVDIKPSVLYGNGLKLHYTIDIFTGVLSCDVLIVDNNENPNRTFILTTIQTNVKTELPIIGNAAQSGMFSSLTSAIIGAMGGKDDSAIIAAGINAADDMSKMGTGAAVGKSSVDGIGAYMSNRQPYFIITRPIPYVPEKYLDLMGSPSHMGGKVSDFRGFSVFDSVDLSGINATESEKSEIESMLKGGVFV